MIRRLVLLRRRSLDFLDRKKSTRFVVVVFVVSIIIVIIIVVVIIITNSPSSLSFIAIVVIVAIILNIIIIAVIEVVSRHSLYRAGQPATSWDTSPRRPSMIFPTKASSAFPACLQTRGWT